MIDEKYITSFVALHEIDELKPTTAASLANVGQDDLFFMSKMVSAATSSENAKMVSKKISYKNLTAKLSSDLGLSTFEQLSADISSMSACVDEQIEDVRSTMQNVSSEIEDDLAQAIDGLSSTIEDEYALKSSGLIDVAWKPSEESAPDASIATIATKIAYEDGVPVVVETQPATWLVNPDGFKSAAAGITTEKTSSTERLVNEDQLSIVYEISTDCYLNIQLSAYEYATSSPIQVVLSSYDNSTAIVHTFNNVGGFEGTRYLGFYQAGVMTKSIRRSAQPFSRLSAIVKRLDSSDYLLSGTKVLFEEMPPYAIPSKDELSSYAKIPLNLQDGIENSQPHVMKLVLDSQGMVVSALSVPYGYATRESYGFIMLPPEGFGDDHVYPIDLSAIDESTKIAYAVVPDASQTIGGVVKTGFNPTEDLAGVSCSIDVDLNGNAFAVIPAASVNGLGVTKLGFQDAQDDMGGISAALLKNGQNQAFVNVPVAGIDTLGVVKTGPDNTAFSPVKENRFVFVNDRAEAMVNVMTDGSYQAQNFFSEIDPAVNSSVNSIDILKTLQLADDTAIEVGEDETVQSFAREPDGMKKSKLGKWKWSCSINQSDLAGKVVAVYAVYHGHSNVQPQHGVQMIVDDVATVAFFPTGCKTTDDGEWFDTKFVGAFSCDDSKNDFVVEAVSGSKSFQNEDEVDQIQIIVRDLMR